MELSLFSSFDKIVFNTFKDVVTIKNLFIFLEVHFEELTLESNKQILLKLLQHADRLFNTDCQKEVSEFLCNLILSNSKNERYLAAALQLVYQFLNILGNKVHVTKIHNAFDELAKKLCGFFDMDAEAMNRDPVCNARILVCLKICLNKLHAAPNILQELWNQCLEKSRRNKNNKLIIFITIQLYDELTVFVPEFQINNIHWCEVLQHSLQSEECAERKTVYFLLKKHLQNCENMKMQQSFWNSYINILESLEENQSHLVLPALHKIPKDPTKNNELKIWLNILYIKMLQQRSLPIIRFGIDYILNNYTIATISECVLQQLLLVTNNTAHYDKNGYCLSKENNFSNFLGRDVPITAFYNFLNTFVQINWKPLPMYMWLIAFPQFLEQQEIKEKSTKIKIKDVKQLMLVFAARVRSLQNKDLRLACILKFYEIFRYYLDTLSLNEYLLLVETLYNIQDHLCYLILLHAKLKLWMENNCKDHVIFSERFGKIFSNTESGSIFDANSLLFFLKKLSVAVTGCFHVVLIKKIFEQSYEINILNDIFCKKYNLNLHTLKKEAKYHGILLEFDTKLTRESSMQEKEFIKECAIIFYLKECVDDLSYFVPDNKYDSLKQILKTGGRTALLRLVYLLFQRCKKLEGIENIAMEIMKTLFSNHNGVIEIIPEEFNVPELMNSFFDLNPQLATKYAENLLLHFSYDISRRILASCIKLDVDLLVKGLLHDDIAIGDARIELDYVHQNNITYYYVCYLLTQNNERKAAVISKLLRHGQDLHKKKSRYYENSGDHRQHIKVAYFVGILLYNTDHVERKRYSNTLLEILLHQNNQLNVTLMYEYMTALSIFNFEELFAIITKIKSTENLKPRQHVSIISMINCFCLGQNTINMTEDQFDKLCRQILLPLTMGAKFQTRLYAMLVIHSVLSKRFPLSNPTYKEAIEIAIGGLQKIQEHVENDPHMILPQLTENKHGQLFVDILFMTNAPNDIFPLNAVLNELKLGKIRDYLKASKVADINLSVPIIQSESYDKKDSMQNELNLQRKMNPAIDIIGGELHGLFPYPMTERDQQMYVVTSLIDKTPNLGGIARSCEVLGIKNYVIKNKMLIENHEFKRLSTTAEKSLNVLEVKVNDLRDFLMQKQTEGFKIVGAEQTAKSESFVNFLFPKKCVLLLGHEKEGISPEFLTFLDHAVEIPQYGLVRSLNVHVTAALFMWEYCKQHIFLEKS